MKQPTGIPELAQTNEQGGRTCLVTHEPIEFGI